MEWLDVVDSNDQLLGFTKPKHEIHRDGDWHRTTHVYVLNPAGELLCNLRHPEKDVFASCWDLCFGGHVAVGESYRDGALRELEEEAGVRPAPDELQYLYSIAVDGYDIVSGLTDREHTAVFVYQTREPLSYFRYQEEEIAELRYVPMSNLLTLLGQPDAGFPIVPLPRMYEDALRMLTVFRETGAVDSGYRPRFSWQ